MTTDGCCVCHEASATQFFAVYCQTMQDCEFVYLAYGLRYIDLEEWLDQYYSLLKGTLVTLPRHNFTKALRKTKINSMLTVRIVILQNVCDRCICVVVLKAIRVKSA